MARFVISYDLRKPNYTEADYEDLYEELAALDAKHIFRGFATKNQGLVEP